MTIMYNFSNFHHGNVIHSAKMPNGQAEQVLVTGFPSTINSMFQSGEFGVPARCCIKDYNQVNLETLARHNVSLVLTPLIFGRKDALDMAEKLRDCGFRGLYKAIASGLPNLQMILQEINVVCDAFDFEIVDLKAL